MAILKMNLSHRKAFELYQKSIDGHLSAEERARLDHHLATCAECRGYVTLYRQLKAGSLARGPVATPARRDVQQAIRQTRTRFKKRQMLRRLFSPVWTAAWVGVVVALAMVVTWMLKIPDPQPQTGLTIQVTVEVTPTLAPVPEWATATPFDQAHDTPSPTLTPRPTARATAAFLSAYFYTQEEVVADVDLNCDGLEERLLKVNLYTRNPDDDNLNPAGIVGVILKVPAQKGYRNTWAHYCELGQHGYPDCYGVEVKLLATDSCEQFVTVGGYFDDVSRLTVFRWDGRDMSVVLDVLAGGYAVTQDPFVLTTMNRECTTPTRCASSAGRIISGTGTRLSWKNKGRK
jgi:hypothetical protein